MRVPILRQGATLIASIQDALADDELLEFRGDLVSMAGQYRSRGCIIDVTALDVMDSYAAVPSMPIAPSAKRTSTHVPAARRRASSSEIRRATIRGILSRTASGD